MYPSSCAAPATSQPRPSSEPHAPAPSHPPVAAPATAAPTADGDAGPWSPTLRPPRAAAPCPADARVDRMVRDGLEGHVLLLMGYPGSGKGTQGARLQRRLSPYGPALPHVSTGALFRREAARATPVGRAMQAAMHAGVPVDDATVFPFLRDTLRGDAYRRGFVLDGFPKNASSLAFVRALLQELDLPVLCTVHLDVTRAAAQARLAQRQRCERCAADYQAADLTTAAPCTCPRCHGPLAGRDDDQEAAIAARLDTFDRQTRPLLPELATLGAVHTLTPAEGPAAAQKLQVERDLVRALCETLLATLPRASAWLRPPPLPRRGTVFHSHIDGANTFLVRRMAADVESRDPTAQHRITPVAHLCLGPQVADPAFASFYARLPNFHAIDAAHGRDAQAEGFATGHMGRNGFAQRQIARTLEVARAHPHSGAMVELEEELFELRIAADGAVSLTLDRGDTSQPPDWRHLATHADHRLHPVPAFELHHGIDLPKCPGETAPPIALDHLVQHSTAAGLNVGGWFLFASEDRWKLRSNEFSNAPYAASRARLEAQAETLGRLTRTLLLTEAPRPFTSSASLERVHAVWVVP